MATLLLGTTVGGYAAIHAGNIGSQSVNYANTSGSTTGSAGSVVGLTLTSSSNGINPDNVTQNQIGYNTSISLFGQTDGGLYSSAYSSSWIHQIYGDFRTGQIAVRGKNNGTWQSWRRILDETNFTSWAATAAQGTKADTAFGWGNHASAGYATTSYVSTQIANLVASAPAALDTLNELAAALGNDASFSTTVSTALGNRLRIDIGTQGLTSTQQGYGRTNLGLGSLATLSSIGNSYITDVAWSKVTGAPSFLTSYSETDTLASVTARGATTSTETIYTGGLRTRKSQTAGDYTTAALWTESYNNTATGIAFHISGVKGTFLEMRTNTVLYWDGNTVYHSGNLTNLNQLTNGPGYITGITSANVTTALGFTPYNSTNPSGYISSITSANVTTALGYTPVPNTRTITINGTAYDLSADRSWTVAGSVTGGFSLTTQGTANNTPSSPSVNVGVYGGVYAFIDLATQNGNGSWIDFSKGDGTDYSGRIRYTNTDDHFGFHTAGGAEKITISSTGVLSILKTGTLISHSGMTDAIGYNSSYGTYIGSTVGGTYYLYANGTFYDNGTFRSLIHSGNIGSQSVNYATSSSSSTYATSAGTLTSNATLQGSLNAPNGYSFIAQGYNNSGGFAMNNASTYWGLMWNYAANDWRLGYGSTTGQQGWNLRWDASGNTYHNGTANFNYISNGSVWINNGSDYNSYNENIRLFNAPNGVSVIAFGASGTSGQPTTSILGYSDRLEYRYGSSAVFRMYSGYAWSANSIYTDAYLYTNYNVRVGEIWSQGGLYRSSGLMLFGTENEGWRFSMANDQKVYIGTDGNIWMRWAGDYLSNLLAAKASSSHLHDDRYFFDRGFGSGYPSWDANTIASNSSGFTYANNAPLTGAIAHFGAGGYGIQLNGDYGGDSFSMRSRNGDNATWRPWKRLLTDYNYNNYSPTLTGGNASGTWGISISGVASQVTINYNNDSNSTYQLLWGSGNSVYGTSQVYVNPNSDVIYARGGFISPGNPWGTSDSAYFPNGITTAGGTNWIYGTTYIGNAPANGNGHQFWADGNQRTTRYIYLDANYGQTIVGLYSSTRYQGIFAMGDSYKLPLDGSSTGSLYGMAWSHPNAGGVASNLNTHGLLVMENGTFLAAISGSIRARDDVRAPAIYDSGSRVAISRGEGRNYVDYSRYVYNNGSYSGSGWVEPSDLGVRYASSAGRADMLNGYGAAYGDTHPGHGLRVWYDWAYSGTYRNGITIGSHPSDTYYGWQIFQNMWDDRTYTRRYNGGFQATRTLMTLQDDPYAGNMNQYVRTSDAPTFSDVYVNGWFRNNGNNTGLYNQSNGNHFYSNGGGSWGITGNGGNVELQFRSNHQSTLRGYVYGDTSSNFGLLNDQGGWSVRCYSGGGYGGALSGSWTASGDLIAYSDERVKTNISTIENALDKILSMRGVTYERTDGDDRSQKVGVIAQEIQKILPQVVHEQDNGMLGVSYGNIVGVLIEAIKEQQKEIEVLKAKLN